MLTVEQLCFRYGRSTPPVLAGVNLSLGEGEIGIVLGKNGSGKTTLFKLLLGICKPQSGQLRFEDRDLLHMPRRERARTLAYVPQDIRFGALTVFDSVLMGRLSYFDTRAGEEDFHAVEKILADMGLTELATRNVDELSGGERQKIAIARAMAQEPRLLIFDEPTGNLDIANEQLILREAARLAHEKNISVLMSLHDLNQALQFGDRFFFLKDGTVRYSCRRQEVTEEIISDIYGIAVRMVEVDHQTVLLNRVTE